MDKIFYVFSIVAFCAINSVNSELRCYVCTNCPLPSSNDLQTCGPPTTTTIIPSTEPSTESSTESSTEPSTVPSTVLPTEPSTSSTESSTESTTELSTALPIEPSTALPTEPSTALPTEPSTVLPTEPSTESSTELSTVTSSESSTELSAEPSTDLSTELTTEPSTESSTELSTELSTESSIGLSTDPLPYPVTDSEAKGKRYRRSIGHDSPFNQGCICDNGKCDCSGKYASMYFEANDAPVYIAGTDAPVSIEDTVSLTAVTYQCYTHTHTVDGFNVIDRGCKAVPLNETACSVLNATENCHSCDTDRCNSAISLQLSISLLVISIFVLHLHTAMSH